MQQIPTSDPHAQLRSLYVALLQRQDRFEEFKRLLALYDYSPEDGDSEPEDARLVRERLNESIRAWTGQFEGLSVTQAQHWRAIVVDDRFNVAISPWKEANVY